MDISNFNMAMANEEAINKTIGEIIFEKFIHYTLNICEIEKYGYKFRSIIANTSLFDRMRNRIKLVFFILTLKEENPLYDFGNRKFLGHDFKRYTDDSVVWSVRSDEIKDLKIKDLLIMMDNFINEIYIEELEHRIEKDNVIIAHETDKENEILTFNELRIMSGRKPYKEPKADELRNKNLNKSNEDSTKEDETWEIIKNLYEMLDAPTETNNKSDINKL